MQAARGADGKVRVVSLWRESLLPTLPVEVPVRGVSAVGCTEDGRRLWVAGGGDGGQMLLLSVRDGSRPSR